MSNILRRSLHNNLSVRFSSNLSSLSMTCKLLVIGAGAGGCAVAHRFARRLKKDEVVVLEPNEMHYFKEQLALVGAGMKSLWQSREETRTVLPRTALWLHEKAVRIDANNMRVITKENNKIHCEYMVIAVGRENDYDVVPGLAQALEDPKSGVCSIYNPKYAEKTRDALMALRSGEAVFTRTEELLAEYVPEEIAFMADALFTEAKVRDKIRISYNTVGFNAGKANKYVQKLHEITKRKKIVVSERTELKEIKPDEKEAIFFSENRAGNKTFSQKYDLLHVAPKMFVPSLIHDNKELRDNWGLLDVDNETMQHRRHPNIFGIGDCLPVPVSNSVASRGPQSYVLEQNLVSLMNKRPLVAKYNGYRAVPYLTEYKKAILAEYIDLHKEIIHETFPCNQAIEKRFFNILRRYVIPYVYWNKLIKGKYNGNETLRAIINPLDFN